MSEKSGEAYRTIGEAAEEVGVPAHVLRFWETKFSQIRPIKRANGRRFYRPTDVALLCALKRLLHDHGMTIRGAQRVLKEQGVAAVVASGNAEASRRNPESGAPNDPAPNDPTPNDPAPIASASSGGDDADPNERPQRRELENVLDDLASARAVLERMIGDSEA